MNNGIRNKKGGHPYLTSCASYAKILGETNFHTWEIPQSESKAKDGERKREIDRKLVITMASYALQSRLGQK